MIGLLLIGILLGEVLGSSEDRLGILGASQRGASKWMIKIWTDVGLVPLPERCSVNVYDARLDEGLSTKKLVVRRIVPLKQVSTIAEPPSCLLSLDQTTIISKRTDYPLEKVKRTDDLNQSRLPRNMLAPPSKVPRIESECAVLHIATTSPDLVDTFRRVKLCHCRLTTEFELSFLTAGRRAHQDVPVKLNRTH